MLWYRLGQGFVCTPFPDRSLNEETVRPEVETPGCGDRQLDPVNCPFGTVLEFLQACFSAGLAHRFPPVLRPEKLMLSGGSGCIPITSSPLISPRLWESRLTHLKVWRPPRPFRYYNAAGRVRFLTKICEPLLALLFSCSSTLSRLCNSGGVDISFPKCVSTQLDVPRGERPRLRM